MLNILRDLQKEFGLTYLFIAHNLSVVEHISDRVAVMYLGKMAELADRDRAVSQSAASLHRGADVRHPDRGSEAQAQAHSSSRAMCPARCNPPSGCRFHPRCPVAQQICSEKVPEFRELKPGHWAACHFAETFIQ